MVGAGPDSVVTGCLIGMIGIGSMNARVGGLVEAVPPPPGPELPPLAHAPPDAQCDSPFLKARMPLPVMRPAFSISRRLSPALMISNRLRRAFLIEAFSRKRLMCMGALLVTSVLARFLENVRPQPPDFDRR